MKSVTYQPAIRQAGPLFDLAQKATQRLDETIGPPAADLEAEWDATEDAKGQPVATFRLRYLPDEASTTVPAEMMHKERALDFRLLDVWGKVLRDRNHRLLRSLLDEGGNGNAEQDTRG